MEPGFLFLDEALDGVQWDARYATSDNFTGRPVDGYGANRIVVSRAVADGLLQAQRFAAVEGFGLLIWDGYRPQRAVDCFVRWAAQPEDGRTKARFYPRITRQEMFAEGYLAAKSGHSRGAAVDLTLTALDTGKVLPMGGEFDFMDRRSHHDADGVPAPEAANRRFLRSIMERSGFAPLANEWWHYALIAEPYPERYFDFPIG